MVRQLHSSNKGIDMEDSEHTRTFVTKDSGKRQEFSTGMKRDTTENKPRYDLIPRFMLKRWAGLMERGAQKYDARNWEKAKTVEELNRFKESAIRHFYQWLDNEMDEDHAAAILFNVSGAELVKERLRKEGRDDTEGSGC